jgi:hypothetical protein
MGKENVNIMTNVLIYVIQGMGHDNLPVGVEVVGVEVVEVVEVDVAHLDYQYHKLQV